MLHAQKLVQFQQRFDVGGIDRRTVGKDVVNVPVADVRAVPESISPRAHFVMAATVDPVAGLHIRSTSTLVQHALMDTFWWVTCSVATIHSRMHYYWQKTIDICQLGACIRTEILPTTRWQILSL
ncbi:unnamed protein product [Phytophthora fragariaefolia]|uniref:Unnamed protein product n=1 Tax=Phytophthora fragariaefolia TaxID=1490495 RepID=A0A9W6TTS0_9STRA|nr:unnamed protein product [Phytophthora fragariaefolia]